MDVPLRRRGTQARRHPSRRVALPPKLGPQHQTFELLVETALDGLPDEILHLLENVAIVIDDEPSPEQLDEEGLEDDETLYGLYEGVPLSEWGGDSVPVPTRIIVFRLPLEEDFPDPDDLADEVRVTILHELAHHLGIEDEDRLAELGID